jgi:SAM-dependent methyltransferase
MRNSEFLNLEKALRQELGYSVRRYFIDKFFIENVNSFKSGSLIIDIGGKKEKKRGYFNIEKYPLNVKYLNSDKKTNPDYFADASSIPVSDKTFDGVILAEVLEHVFDPKKILAEAYRVLKPCALLLISVPFSVQVHPDPNDYGRYTEQWFNDNLKEIGFENIEIEKQGLFFSVLAFMFKWWVYELAKVGRPKFSLTRKLIKKFVFWFPSKAFELDKKNFYRNNKFFSGYTTGYGIRCFKKK